MVPVLGVVVVVGMAYEDRIQRLFLLEGGLLVVCMVEARLTDHEKMTSYL